ncbi:MAG TPA: hypothetical protein VFI78_06985 [Salinimicrobium sp.]|nr:hypothetical protein [Salinimicrobium sp.]
MEQAELTSLLQHPGKITSAQTAELNDLLDEFPYFQAARAVRLKGLKNETSLHYNKELKSTAAYTTDRSVLFDFITSEEFNQDEIADQIKKQGQSLENISETELNNSEKTENIPLENALKLKIRETEKSSASEGFISEEEKSEEKAIAKDKPENNLNLGMPLAFQKNENHSFAEWLKLTKAEPIQREAPEENPGSKPNKFELIDKFISKSPKIKPTKTGKKINLAEKHSTTPESLMTETLARVYLEQKNYKKAVQAFKILILKNPEKSGFFADQIRAIEKIQEQNIQK